MEFEKSIDNTRQGFEKSFQEATFYEKQTTDASHLKLLLNLVCPKNGEVILDLGTGTGYMAFALANCKVDCKIIGIDIVTATLERNMKKALEQNYSNLEFISYDGKTYPFKDKSFNTIITRYALHHFPNIEDSLREIFRVLKTDGKLVISDPTPNKDDFVGFVDRFMQKKSDGHIKFYTFEEFDSMLENAGFRLVSKQDSMIRFPRKNPKEYEDLLLQYNKDILDGYEIKIMGDEIWIKEKVLNMVYQKV